MSLVVPGAVITDADVPFYEALVERRDRYATQLSRAEHQRLRCLNEIERLHRWITATEQLLAMRGDIQ